MVKGLHHYSRTVSNIDVSKEFFQKYFGFKEKLRRDNVDAAYVGKILNISGLRLHMLFMEGHGIVVEFFEFLNPKGEKLDCRTPNTGSTHLCFLVEDLHSMYEEMKRDGVKMISEEPIAIDQGNHAGGYSLYLLDPDDSVIELIQLP